MNTTWSSQIFSACRSMSKMLPLFGSVGNPMNNSKVSMDTSRRKLFLPVNIFKWSSVISTGGHSPPCLELRVTLFLSWCSMQPRNLQHLYLLQGMFSSPIYSFLGLFVNKGYLHGRWSTSSTLPNQKGHRGVTIGSFHFLPSYNLRLVPAQDVLFALILWYVAKSYFRS